MFHYKCLCLDNIIPCGIHGMIPREPLHVIDFGMFFYLLECFWIALGLHTGSSSQSSIKIHQEVDSMLQYIRCFLGHQSDRGLPRTYFPFGITGGTKLAEHEYQGVLLVALIMWHMEETHKHVLTKMSGSVLNKWIRLKGAHLTFEINERPYWDPIVWCFSCCYLILLMCTHNSTLIGWPVIFYRTYRKVWKFPAVPNINVPITLYSAHS